ncbi:MAG: pyridoxal phosphate-dependent decarboxylase family protein [Acidimicrobiales bacterium]
MDPEAFRRAGHELIDWIADHRGGVESRPVRRPVEPGSVAAALPAEPPTVVEDVEALLADLDRIVVPAITDVQHPMFYGWFPSNAGLASVLGDLASSGIGALGISWESAPALTEVEQVVCDWMRQLTGLSDAWSGSINDTASTSCLVAMLLARERAGDYAQTRGGLSELPAPLLVYSTGEAHSSVRKAALLAGFGADHLRIVPIDPVTRAMDPGAFRAMVADDLAGGARPAAVVASSGTTGTTAFDPLAEVVEVASRHGIWVHVDAAMAGSALILPEERHRFDGIEGADSLCWNPHKWLGSVLDTSLFYVRDTEHLVRVMSSNPSYLRSRADGEVVQYRDWGLPLGRRFRALKLWFLLRLDGVEAIQARLRRDLVNAAWLADQVEAADDWTLVAPCTLQTVCVRHQPDGLDDEELDAHTVRWAAELNDSGRAYVTPSLLDGSWMVRVSIGAERTEAGHVERLWAAMQETVGVDLLAGDRHG